MSALLDKHPEYKAVEIIQVDWDKYASAPIVRELKIPRRATLVMFTRGKEISRVVANSNPGDISAMFEAALKPA